MEATEPFVVIQCPSNIGQWLIFFVFSYRFAKVLLLLVPVATGFSN
jgi:hypothetical protein